MARSRRLSADYIWPDLNKGNGKGKGKIKSSGSEQQQQQQQAGEEDDFEADFQELKDDPSYVDAADVDVLHQIHDVVDPFPLPRSRVTVEENTAMEFSEQVYDFFPLPRGELGRATGQFPQLSNDTTQDNGNIWICGVGVSMACYSIGRIARESLLIPTSIL